MIFSFQDGARLLALRWLEAVSCASAGFTEEAGLVPRT